MVPRLRPHHCLAARTACSVCVERCPAPGALRIAAGLPVVNEAACTGCGQCLTVCPAPIMAFDLVARAQP
jgi:Fe-S-cluster-containing hydrogenase component 2